jgi:ATP-dependent Lon protease
VLQLDSGCCRWFGIADLRSWLNLCNHVICNYVITTGHTCDHDKTARPAVSDAETIDNTIDNTSNTGNSTDVPDHAITEILPILPLPDGVVLPDMIVTVSAQSEEAQHAIEAAGNDRLLLLPRIDGKFARVGVVGIIEDRGTLPNGSPALTVRAHHRLRVGVGVVGNGAALWVEAEPVDETPSDDADVAALAADYRAIAKTMLSKIGGRRLAGALDGIDSPGSLADSIGYWPELTLERRVQLLETAAVDARLELATSWVKEALAELEVTEAINQGVTDDLEKGQREAILRRQLTAIQDELGEGSNDAIAEYRTKLADAAMPTAASEAVSKEIDRLERTGTESMESNWIRTWLDSVFELPWGTTDAERLDLVRAREILDADHTGLDDVKERLIEHLAVRKLRTERNVDDDAGDRRGVILALVGPPGVGKTSLGQSIAASLDRKFVRLALGGIRDEAEIRGHRRTYVGARPGRLVRALTEAGSMNPVILLDEIDKVGNSWQGDPSSALLEVLDPAQNNSFRDHYLEFELDLSDVVFVATANVLDTIPGPLLDRMEIISLEGYSEREKTQIGKEHLLPKVMRSNGLEEGEVVFDDGTIEAIAGDYTREAGVRRLERLLDKAVRKSAATIVHDPTATPIVIQPDDLRDLLGKTIPSEDAKDRIDRPGIATGLAVTGAGGDVLFVETALVPGDGEPVLTGQLGDVMRESATLARSLVARLADERGYDYPDGKRLHVHFPAGAIPKDGPSAGITMTTALVSLLSGRIVRPEVAMTGEVTLQGRVLPIGGVKQKVLAAHRAGITEVILPKANGEDLEDVPADILDQLTVHLADTIDEVLDIALA